MATETPKGEHGALFRREVSIAQREHAVERREVALEKREDAVARREAAVEKREDSAERLIQILLRRCGLHEAKSDVNEVVPRDDGTRKAERGMARHADPIGDVPALVEAYQRSGGLVPVGVVVAEVQAHQESVAYLQFMAASCDNQLQQLDGALKLDLTKHRREWIEQSHARLQEDKGRYTQTALELLTRVGGLRDAGVERYIPLLMQNVDKYDAAFEAMLDPDDEVLLERVCALCAPFEAKGRTLRQALPSALPPESLATLILLLDLAIQAGPRLLQLAKDAVAHQDGCEVVAPPRPTKGIARALQKTLEEYGGDYTRLLDYARITIVFDSVASLVSALAWLVAPEREPRFRPVRIKDRLSRAWDAVMSGGNRDVMVNGLLELGGGRHLIVEVQLHIRCLYELKSDLHVLYAGARVLGAMEDATAKHQGALTDRVLGRARRGVVRKLLVSATSISAPQKEELAKMMKSEPCAALELDLSYASTADLPAFQGWTLSQLIVPSTGTLACRRLRTLIVTWCGLVGEVPPEVNQCSSLTDLALSNNTLSGSIPSFHSLRSLKKLQLSRNKLTGPVPESLGNLSNLVALNVNENMLSGKVPSAALAKLTKLKELRLGSGPLRRDRIPEKWYNYLEAHGVLYEGCTGNRDLFITAAGKAELAAALTALTVSLDDPNVFPKVDG